MKPETKALGYAPGGFFNDWQSLKPAGTDDDTASDLGFKENDLFVLLIGNGKLTKGTIVRLTEDDDTTCPYFDITVSGKGRSGEIYLSFNEVAKLPVGTVSKGKQTNHTYSKTYTRSDGRVFKKDMIDGTAIDTLIAQEKEHYAQAKRIRGLLNAHSKLTF